MGRFRSLLLLPLLLIAAGATLKAQEPYWNNLKVYRLNKMQPHDRIIPEGQQWRMSLDGRWAFAYFDNPAAATLTPRHWDSIDVPGNIELQGFGVPVYVNMRNEFPSNPPAAPADYNPTAVYSRTFSLPPSWTSRRTIVKFGAVRSAMYLYVNGREVGYSEDSKTPAEWDITRYLTPGRNSMKVKVVRWCNGSYLECQDMWRMSGITRSVELYSVPTTYLTDVKIIADIDTANPTVGRLDVMVDLNREVQDGSVEVRCCGQSLKHRFEHGDWFASVQTLCPGITPWSDTTPMLYPLTIILRDDAGHETERLEKHIGFRHVDIVGGQLRVNGHPVEIRGVNRHEHSAVGGQYVTAEEMRRDVAMMKEMGINAVRTCHYPNDELWYDLCDSAGLYVWDEANVESHAQGYGEHSLAKKSEWLNPILDRIYNMYRRDRNHPSIIVWSLGNECGNGYCFEEAYRFLKSRDDTRPVSYERAELEWNTDIVGVMYPSVQFLSEYARNQQSSRPYIMVEYCHAMGNSMGGLQDYWDTIDKYPLLQGGFVWDWIDQAFPLTDSLGRRWWAAGGDLGSLPGITDDGNFCANGILAADRTPHPHAAEVAAVYQRGLTNVVTPEQPLPQAFSPSESEGRMHLSRTATSLTVAANNCSVSFNTTDGSITSWRKNGQEILATPLRLNLFRPPTDNDYADPSAARAWHGLDHLQPQILGFHHSVADSMVSVSFDIMLLTPDGAKLRVREVVDVSRSGALQWSCLLMPRGEVHTLPKVGLQLGLDTAVYQNCAFFGNLCETYPDRRSAQRIGRWYKSLTDLSAPQYIKPQEQGNREVQWVRFLGDDAIPLNVASKEEWINFSLRRHDDRTTTAARRWRDMPPDDPFFTISLDYRQAGLGTATCGPATAERFRLSGDSTYRFSMILTPGNEGTGVRFPHHEEIFGQLPTDATTETKIAASLASCQPAPNDKYSANFPDLLFDGKRALPGDYASGWAGFLSTDTLLLDIDVIQPSAMSAITVGVCHSPADWVIRPLCVEAQWSADGKKWSKWHTLSAPATTAGDMGESRRLNHVLKLKKSVRAKKVRLRFTGRKELPVWHPYGGEPAWLMIDEVSLESR